MYLLFQTLKENRRLASQELQALCEIFSINSSSSEQTIKQLCKRATQIHFAGELVAELKSLSDFKKLNFSFVKSPFCIRVSNANSKLEKELAKPVWNSLKKPSVDLDRPKTLIRLIIQNKKIFVARQIWHREKGLFNGRKPHEKPAFHPTALMPKLARLLVNLSRAKENEVLLDPFCGTGAILVEAKLVGCKIQGSDFDEEMLKMAKTNLKHFRIKNYRLKKLDATKLEKHFRKNSIDAIACDPPYGRSSKVCAKNVKQLYERFLKSAHKVLKKKRYLAFICPDYLKVKLNKKHWKLVSSAEIYVHKSLTRKVLVLQKK